MKTRKLTKHYGKLGGAHKPKHKREEAAKERMSEGKRERLEKAGWKVGTADEFLYTGYEYYEDIS